MSTKQTKDFSIQNVAYLSQKIQILQSNNIDLQQEIIIFRDKLRKKDQELESSNNQVKDLKTKLYETEKLYMIESNTRKIYLQTIFNLAKQKQQLKKAARKRNIGFNTEQLKLSQIKLSKNLSSQKQIKSQQITIMETQDEKNTSKSKTQSFELDFNKFKLFDEQLRRSFKENSKLKSPSNPGEQILANLIDQTGGVFYYQSEFI